MRYFALFDRNSHRYHGTMNQGKTPLFTLHQECSCVEQKLTRSFDAVGIRFIRSFDLKMAQSAKNVFSCPVHTTAPCTCQLVILLVYPQNCSPLGLILEGRDAETLIYLETNSESADQSVDPLFSEVVLRALFQDCVQ